MVAVDLRFPITERDPEIGYVLFEYQDSGRSYAGSLELVRGSDARAPVRVVAQVGAMPTYIERMILDRLARKLGEDYGPPAPRPPAQQPQPPQGDAPDAGAPDAGTPSE